MTSRKNKITCRTCKYVIECEYETSYCFFHNDDPVGPAACSDWTPLETVGKDKKLLMPIRLIEAVTNLIEALPSCDGEWTDGSGGHRVHEACNKPATWGDDCYSYCEEHATADIKEIGADQYLYADELRNLIAILDYTEDK